MSTERRRELIGSAPVVQAPVLYEGVAPRHLKDLQALIRPSLAKSADWLGSLRAIAAQQGLDVERAVAETEDSSLAEGLYIKVEEDGVVTERYKWVRRDFLQTMMDNDSHWLSRQSFRISLRREGAFLTMCRPRGRLPSNGRGRFR